MDFLTICQALGVAIAVGLIVGSVLPPAMPVWGVIAGAAPIGILAGVMILSGEDDPVWPAVATGILGGGVAGLVSRDIATGAARRARGGTEAARTTAPIAAFIFLAAVVVGGLSLLVPPVAIVVFVALGWMALNRRRTAEQKHEGLRVLR